MILGSQVKSGAGRENPNLTSGSKAKQREIKVLELNVATPVDDFTALVALKDSRQLFVMILLRFRDGSILTSIKQINSAIKA